MRLASTVVLLIRNPENPTGSAIVRSPQVRMRFGTAHGDEGVETRMTGIEIFQCPQPLQKAGYDYP